jgi:soluble lytic murein transglycosylase-like protein
VEALIRQIWPDDLEEQALEIAWRESNFRPDVTSSTGCCVGVFQMHWEAHKSWLIDMGISSRDQLFDARTNIEAAYTLYQRSGGWGPWAL